MANFDDRVMGLTGLTISGSSSAPSQAELTTFLTDGAREIINILPPSLQEYCIGATSIDDTDTTLAIHSKTNMGKILYVTRESATASAEKPCRKIPAAFKDLASDSTSLKYFGTSSDPVYWITGTQTNDTTTTTTILEVYPTPTSAQSAIIYHIAYPAVAYNNSTISNFPDSAEYLVVLYAAMKSLLSAIGSLEIPPNVTDEDANTTSLTDDIVALTSDQVGTDDDFQNFNKWFTALGEMIEDDEDIELASAQIEKINSYVNTWNIQLQGNLAEMQQYMQLYQTLKADYTMGIQMLVSGGLPQAQPQKAGR